MTELHWILTVAGSAVVALVGVVLFLARVSFKLGTIAQDFHRIAEDMKDIKSKADKVPVLESELRTTKELYEGIHSDIKHLLRRSQPDYEGE